MKSLQVFVLLSECIRHLLSFVDASNPEIKIQPLVRADQHFHQLGILKQKRLKVHINVQILARYLNTVEIDFSIFEQVLLPLVCICFVLYNVLFGSTSWRVLPSWSTATDGRICCRVITRSKSILELASFLKVFLCSLIPLFLVDFAILILLIAASIEEREC